MATTSFYTRMCKGGNCTFPAFIPPTPGSYVCNSLVWLDGPFATRLDKVYDQTVALATTAAYGTRAPLSTSGPTDPVGACITTQGVGYMVFPGQCILLVTICLAVLLLRPWRLIRAVCAFLILTLLATIGFAATLACATWHLLRAFSLRRMMTWLAVRLRDVFTTLKSWLAGVVCAIASCLYTMTGLRKLTHWLMIIPPNMRIKATPDGSLALYNGKVFVTYVTVDKVEEDRTTKVTYIPKQVPLAKSPPALPQPTTAVDSVDVTKVVESVLAQLGVKKCVQTSDNGTSTDVGESVATQTVDTDSASATSDELTSPAGRCFKNGKLVCGESSPPAQGPGVAAPVPTTHQFSGESSPSVPPGLEVAAPVTTPTHFYIGDDDDDVGTTEASPDALCDPEIQPTTKPTGVSRSDSSASAVSISAGVPDVQQPLSPISEDRIRGAALKVPPPSTRQPECYQGVQQDTRRVPVPKEKGAIFFGDGEKVHFVGLRLNKRNRPQTEDTTREFIHVPCHAVHSCLMKGSVTHFANGFKKDKLDWRPVEGDDFSDTLVGYPANVEGATSTLDVAFVSVASRIVAGVTGVALVADVPAHTGGRVFSYSRVGSKYKEVSAELGPVSGNALIAHKFDTVPGDSGMPIFNTSGHVIALHTGADLDTNTNIAIVAPQVRLVADVLSRDEQILDTVPVRPPSAKFMQESAPYSKMKGTVRLDFWTGQTREEQEQRAEWNTMTNKKDFTDLAWHPGDNNGLEGDGVYQNYIDRRFDALERRVQRDNAKWRARYLGHAALQPLPSGDPDPPTSCYHIPSPQMKGDAVAPSFSLRYLAEQADIERKLPVLPPGTERAKCEPAALGLWALGLYTTKLGACDQQEKHGKVYLSRHLSKFSSYSHDKDPEPMAQSEQDLYRAVVPNATEMYVRPASGPSAVKASLAYQCSQYKGFGLKDGVPTHLEQRMAEELAEQAFGDAWDGEDINTKIFRTYYESNKDSSAAWTGRFFGTTKKELIWDLHNIDLVALVRQRLIYLSLVDPEWLRLQSPAWLCEVGIADPKQAFTKAEPHKDSKARLQRWRIIWQPSMADGLVIRVLLKDMCDQFVDTYSTVVSADWPMANGLGHHDEGHARMHERIRQMLKGSPGLPVHPTLIETDISAFDVSVSDTLIASAFRVFEGYLRLKGAGEPVLAGVRGLSSIIAAHVINIGDRCFTVHTAETSRLMVASGIDITAILDSTVRTMCHWIAMAAPAMSAGDDNMGTSAACEWSGNTWTGPTHPLGRKLIDQLFNGVTPELPVYYKTVMSLLGLQCKDLRLRTFSDGVEFTSHRYRENFYPLYLNWPKMAATIILSTKVSVEQLAAWKYVLRHNHTDLAYFSTLVDSDLVRRKITIADGDLVLQD